MLLLRRLFFPLLAVLAAFVVGGIVYGAALVLLGRLLAPAESKTAIGLLRRRRNTA